MAGKSATAVEIKEATALTDVYASGWVSEWLDVGLASHARLLLTLVKGTATTVELKLEAEQENGTNGYEEFKVADGAASLDEIAITCADLGTTHRIALPIEVVDVRRIRLRAKRTDGTSSTTLAAAVLVGVV